jgi:hypothetical protein
VTRRQAIWLRVVLVPLGVLAGFLLFQHPMRVLETRVVVGHSPAQHNSQTLTRFKTLLQP